MAKVMVKFFGLSHLTGGQKDITLEAVDVLDVLEKIRNKYVLLKEKVFNLKTGRMYPEFMIIVNGRPIYDDTQKLHNGDIIAIWPIFAGG